MQKWAVLSATALGIAALGSGVLVYERYYRGPGEDMLYGDWEAVDFLGGDTIYFRFRPDQTFTAGGLFEGEFNPFSDGRWYAGGPNIYIRFSADDIRAHSESSFCTSSMYSLTKYTFGCSVTDRCIHFDAPL